MIIGENNCNKQIALNESRRIRGEEHLVASGGLHSSRKKKHIWHGPCSAFWHSCIWLNQLVSSNISFIRSGANSRGLFVLPVGPISRTCVRHDDFCSLYKINRLWVVPWIFYLVQCYNNGPLGHIFWRLAALSSIILSGMGHMQCCVAFMHLVKTGFKWYLVLLIKHMFRPLLTGPRGHMQQWDPDRRIRLDKLCSFTFVPSYSEIGNWLVAHGQSLNKKIL